MAELFEQLRRIKSLKVGELKTFPFYPDLGITYGSGAVSLENYGDNPPSCYEVAIHCLTFGAPENPAIVLLGGLSVPWFDWQDVAQRLSATHFVVVFDRVGAGISCAPPVVRANSLRAEVELVLAVMDSYGIAKAHLVGHSMASFIAEAAGRLYPDRFTAVTILDGSYEPKLASPSAYQRLLLRSGRLAAWERVALALNRLPIGATLRKCYAWAQYVAKKRMVAAPGATSCLTPDDDRAVTMATFARTESVIGSLRELRSYELWAEQLLQLAESVPLRVPITIVAAYRLRISECAAWVKYLAGQAEVLRDKNPDAKVTFCKIHGTHLLMRDRAKTVVNLLRAE